MGTVTVGGDPENYMDPPRLSQTDKDGPSIIASILDALGIHKQVAKTDPAAAPKPTQTPAQPMQLPALDTAESVFTPQQGASDWGKKYLDSIKPLKSVDPDTSF